MIRLLSRKRLLVFVVAYNAEKTIESVLQRIPKSLNRNYETEVLVIDDSSKDCTVDRCQVVQKNGYTPFKIHIRLNPENHGYGGNQKIGFQFAIEKGFDFVALVHGDGQYAPQYLPKLLQPLAENKASAVFGSRMLTKFEAIKEGMPLYKYIGNNILTKFQNWILKSSLSEFHSGYRIYSVAALKRIPFHLNTNDFHFDTEIIIQLLFAGMRIKELPIPTYYGDEICHVKGLRYAYNVLLATLKAYAQNLGIFYDRKFDCSLDPSGNRHYVSKLHFKSPQKLALATIPSGSHVLDIGCGGGHLSKALRLRDCKVTGIDLIPPVEDLDMQDFYLCDLNSGNLPVDIANFDYVLLLDVIEHLLRPEEFVEKLRKASAFAPNVNIVVSTGNVGFWIMRVMLLLGQFNYGKRGILDLTHTRLFTFKSFRRIFDQAGFQVLQIRGIPAPFSLAFGHTRFARILTRLNGWLIRLSRSLFAYQIFMVLRPKRSLALLLRDAKTGREKRKQSGAVVKKVAAA
jgi:glycosyltransferase involved in cell wall biosynthesis